MIAWHSKGVILLRSTRPKSSQMMSSQKDSQKHSNASPTAVDVDSYVMEVLFFVRCGSCKPQPLAPRRFAHSSDTSAATCMMIPSTRLSEPVDVHTIIDWRGNICMSMMICVTWCAERPHVTNTVGSESWAARAARFVELVHGVAVHMPCGRESTSNAPSFTHTPSS